MSILFKLCFVILGACNIAFCISKDNLPTIETSKKIIDLSKKSTIPTKKQAPQKRTEEDKLIKMFKEIDYLSKYHQLQGSENKREDFIPISQFKLGIIHTSSFVNKVTINSTINYAINSNFLDGYMDPNNTFKGCYSFISELKKSNFILLNKNIFEYFSQYKFITNPNLFAQEVYDISFEELRNAILNRDEINYLIAVRGGYGSVKLIDHLYKMRKPAKEKILIGFSDVTALHLFLSQEWNWKTIHGPVLKSFSEDYIRTNKFEQDSARKLIFLLTSRKPIKINIGLVPINDAARKARCINGLATGGNATLVQNSLGTKWQIRSNDKILIMEDVSLNYYQIDRIIMQMKQARVFDKVKAVIFGTFSNPSANQENLSYEDFVALSKAIDAPVFVTNKIGHGKHNYPFIINEETAILQNKNGHFVFEQIYQNPFTDNK